MTAHQRSQRKRHEALDVLRVMRPERGAMSISEIADCALGLNSEPKRRLARNAIDTIIYDFHIRIRRRRPGRPAAGRSTLYWVEPDDEALRQAVLRTAEQVEQTDE